MQRFIVLYICYVDDKHYYAEGLVHVDGSVYLRGFYEKEDKLFFDMNGLKNYLRDNEDIQHYHILMIDKEKLV